MLLDLGLQVGKDIDAYFIAEENNVKEGGTNLQGQPNLVSFRMVDTSHPEYTSGTPRLDRLLETEARLEARLDEPGPLLLCAC